VKKTKIISFVKRTKIIPLLIFLAVIIVIFIGGKALANLTGDQLVKKSSGNLIVQSNVEMTETNVNSQTGGEIKEIKIKEGDKVKKGQVLVQINSDSLAAQKAQVEAQIQTLQGQLESAESTKDAAIAGKNAAIAGKNAASSQLEKAQNGSTSQDIASAESSYELLQKTYDRIQSLYNSGYSPKADLDNAQSQLEIAKNKYETVKNGSRPEDIAAAKAQIDQANAQVNQANAQIDQSNGSIESVQGQIKQAQASLEGVNVNINNATIKAPSDGIVTQLNVESGELVSTGMPIVVLTSTTSPSITCNVKETDLSKVKLGQKVSIRVPAYSNKTFSGKVVKINQNADFAVKRATNDNGDFDILSYGVKVEFTNMNKPLHDGMTTFVDFGK